MNWFKKIVPSRIKTKKSQRVKSVPVGVWITCDNCKVQIYRAVLERNLHVCEKCEFGAVQKLESIVGAVQEWANIVDIKNTGLK